MIEVQVPRDVSNYEAQFIGPLTARQTICLAVAAVVEYVYYNVVKFLGIGLDMNALICIGIVIAVPILYLAMGKPYGMKPEMYIYNYLLPSLIAPKNRPYETKLSYDVMLEQIEAIKNEANNKGKRQPKKTQKKKPKPVGKHDRMYL